MSTSPRLNLISYLQNPAENIVGDYKKGLIDNNIDPNDELTWIAFEDRFSVENFSGYNGKVLYEIAVLLTVLNMQGGVASNYMGKIETFPREFVLRLYHKCLKERRISYAKGVFNIVSRWLHENNYICELELNRLLGYRVLNQHEFPILEAFNNNLMQDEMLNYVQKYWNETV